MLQTPLASLLGIARRRGSSKLTSRGHVILEACTSATAARAAINSLRPIASFSSPLTTAHGPCGCQALDGGDNSVQVLRL